jgi:hypothetical protein
LIRAPSSRRIGVSSEVGLTVFLRNNGRRRHDSLQDLALLREQIDVRPVLIAHPEGPVLIKDQPLGVGGQMRVVNGGDGKVNLIYCIDRQGVEAGGGKTLPSVEEC